MYLPVKQNHLPIHVSQNYWSFELIVQSKSSPERTSLKLRTRLRHMGKAPACLPGRVCYGENKILKPKLNLVDSYLFLLH